MKNGILGIGRYDAANPYAGKWDYVVNNPVRHGLVTRGRLALPR
jgi:hypothetical protein